MIIKENRIDDRLIHGQVAITCLQVTGAKAVLVIDDEAAKDEFQKSMLGLACPNGIQLLVKTVEKGAALIKKDTSQVPVLVVIKNPDTARRLAENGYIPSRWTVGNISGKKSETERTQILRYCQPTQKDAADLKAVSDMGCKVIAQIVPNEKEYDLIRLLEKEGML